MSRRFVGGVVALALVAGACGLGDKEAQADRIVDAGDALMRRSSVAAAISLTVRVLPPDRKVVLQEPPRIAGGALPRLPLQLRPKQAAAQIPNTLVFVDDVMYQRIAPKVAASGAARPDASGATNLLPLLGAFTGGTIAPAGSPGQGVPLTTTTTAAPRGLQRAPSVVREWAAVDFAEIADGDSTKHGGSLGVNPVAVLRLATGVLTGSVRRVNATTFTANVSRDKAERKLDEEQREVLDKVFTANAITRRVFPARFVLDDAGQLQRLEVTLRQQLSSKDRADATYVLEFVDAADAPAVIRRPPRRGTVTVATIRELATTVSGQ